MKIVFFGTSDVGLPILEALLSEHEIVHVVTSPDSPVGRKQEITPTPIAQFAEKAQGLAISKPESVRKNEEFWGFLRGLNADIFVVVSYGKILPKELLDIAPLKTVNVHFSLLPQYRGAAPIQFALLNGETTTGTTIFILDELVDHGPILAQAQAPIAPDDTFATLAPKLAKISAQVLLETLPKYSSGEILPQVQDETTATTTKIITKEDGRIDWTKPANEIYNMWRAYTPWPGTFTTYQGENFKILECKPIDKSQFESSDTNETFRNTIIPCGNQTFLELITVQPAGKNSMAMKDFLNGNKNFQAADLTKG